MCATAFDDMHMSACKRVQRANAERSTPLARCRAPRFNSTDEQSEQKVAPEHKRKRNCDPGPTQTLHRRLSKKRLTPTQHAQTRVALHRQCECSDRRAAPSPAPFGALARANEASCDVPDCPPRRHRYTPQQEPPAFPSLEPPTRQHAIRGTLTPR